MIALSIIIPIYNVGRYIETCLQSVVDQTMTECIECILVDDCGQDDSMDIAQCFVDSYNGPVTFRILHHDKNRGLSAARNTGIRNALGEYIYLLDSDDYIIPECLETLYKIAQKYDTDIVQGSYLSDSQYLLTVSTNSHISPTTDAKYIKRTLLDYDKNPVMAQNRLVRRLLIIENHLWFKEGIIHEDSHWTYFLAKHVKRMAFCTRKVYFYRDTPGSITKSINMEKETIAFSTMVRDFTANIDPFERGAQKRYIFLQILSLQRLSDAISYDDYKSLLCAFLYQCSFKEKIVFATAMTSKGMIRQKCINLLQRLFIAADS